MLTIAGDAGRDIASNATRSSIVAVLVLLVASAVAARWLTRRRDTAHGPVAWFAAFAATAGCVSLTLARTGPPSGFRPGDVFAWTVTGWDRLSGTDLLGSSQFLLNIALFVPAGAAWTWVTGRPARTLGGLVALTMVIESLQGVIGGAPDIADVAANSIGALLGVVGAVGVMRGLELAGVSTGGRPSPMSRRRRALVAAGLVVATIGCLTALLVGADRRQAHLRDDLRAVFADTTYEEIDTLVRGDPADLDPDARITDFDQILSAVSERPNGFRYLDDRIEIRWPALFFGFRRCVYVTWQPGGTEYRNLSGSACTDFIDR